MHIKQRQFTDLLRKLKRDAPSRLLNDSIRTLKLSEAVDINRAGHKAQLDALIDEMGMEDVEDLIDELLLRRARIRELTARFKNRRRLAELVQIIYQSKSREADVLVMGDISAQIAFILDLPDGEAKVAAMLN